LQRNLPVANSRLLEIHCIARKESLCDRQLSKLIAVKQPASFRFPKTAFR
jgi:hypothetical protein